MGIQNFSHNDFSCDMKNMKERDEAYVVKGEHPKHGEVAIKTWFRASDINIKDVELLMEVRELIKRTNPPVQNAYHQNIIQLLGTLVGHNSRRIGYVMQYMPNGSLEDIIHNKFQHYDGQQIKSWITQICCGLSYLHGKQIIHRNMKPSNILVGTSYDDVKLSDFGVAKSLDNISSILTRGRGTVLYMAPEIFKGGKYDFSADIYSLSIIIWEILHRRIPYDHTTAHFHLPHKISNGERPQLNNNLSEEVSDLLKSCWHANASKRPPIDEVLETCRETASSLPTNTAENPNKNFFEKQTILLVGGKERGFLNSLLMLENNQQNWKRLNIKLPYVVHSHGAQFLNNNLYIFGGSNKEEKYLSKTYKLSKSLQWEKMADMNKKRRGISNSNVILNNQIWVCGGWSGVEELKSVEMYDPETNKWKYMKPMNECQADVAAAVVNGKIFCAGGCKLNSVECYDPFSDVWTLICNMPQGIGGHGAVEMNGHFVVMGGYNGKECLTNVWALDTTNKHPKWVEKPPMVGPHILFSIAKIHGKIFICGGEDAGYIVEIFNGEVWRNGPEMPAMISHVPAVVIPMEFARSLN